MIFRKGGVGPEKNRWEVQYFVTKSECGVTSSLLSCGKSQSPLVDETPGRGSMTTKFLSAKRQRREV